MAIADFVAESFETDALRGALAGRGHPRHRDGTVVGRDGGGLPQRLGRQRRRRGRSDGLRAGRPRSPVGRARGGGPGAPAARSGPSAEVVEITTDDGRATGVRLASGEEIGARIVVAGADPKRVLTTLLDPVVVGPGMRWRAGNIRTPGTVATVSLALQRLPRFTAAGDGAEAERRLRGRIVIAPGIDYLERAFDARSTAS